MGMDVYGVKPISENGKYFRANLWSWRPIYFLCDYLNEKHNLGFDLSRFGYNDGAGLNSKDSKILAKKMEQYFENHPYLKEDEDRLYLCLGSWTDLDGRFIDLRGRDLLKQYSKGTILYNSVVTKSGKIVQSSHSTSLGHFKEFISFLNSCGGFKIH